MKVTPKQLAAVLAQATADVKGSELASILENFFQLVKRSYLMSRLPEIILEYKKYYLAAQGIIAVKVQSSRPLTSSEHNQLVKQLKALTGKNIELTDTVDLSLGGGIKLQYEDTLIDGTIKRRVENLKSLLKS
ncbi:MAG: ATP synthase F1 subunit delta [Patescibacteria group bacterium]|nr:ATP synthase F1 subunit delta [Patescibacteria group bacterium]